MNIDKRVANLVQTLNDIDGIETASSCGGHVCPELGQVNEYNFYVDFYLNDLSLVEQLAFATDHLDIKLVVWYDDGARWVIEGSNDVDPDFIVQQLAQHNNIL